MLISGLLTGGTLVAGAAKLYERKNRKKKVEPSVAEHQKKKEWPTRISTFLRQTETTLQTFAQNKLAFSRARQKQMKEISGDGDQVSEAEQRMNRTFAIVSGNLTLVGMSLFYHPLIWLTVPPVIYALVPFYRLAYKAAVEEHRVSSYALDIGLMTGMLVGGYFYTVAIGIWFAILGRKLLLQSENNSKRSLSNLFGTQPRSVWVQTDEGVEVEIPFERLQHGDIVMVSAGQTIPIDGVITMGVASIDQHKLTGESQPVEKEFGDKVLASTIVLSGKIGIETEKTGEETVAMQIGQILEQTADAKSSLQSQGEAIAERLTLPTLGLSALLLPLLGYTSALAVLTNTFGYKMRLFAPASMLTFLNIASQEGILIKDGRSLELVNKIDTMIFDKTGTLTLEEPTIGNIYTYHGVCEEDVLRYAAAAEDGQTHPIAKAILAAANARGLIWPEMVDAKYDIGYGIQVNLGGRVIRVGSDRFMAMNNLEIPREVSDVRRYCDEHGYSLVLVAFDTQIVGAVELHATIRPEAQDIVNSLRQRGMSIYIISGDNEAPTQKLARTLGIEHYFANTLPESKANLISKLQEEGKSVCFVGDGINDSIALKKANVSVSLRGATMIATDTAQVILMDGKLNKLGKLFDIAQELEANMKNNLYISTVPSAICMSGIILFHWGVLTGMTITISTLFTGIINSIYPLLTQDSVSDSR